MRQEYDVLEWWKKNESLLLSIARKSYSIPEDIAAELVQEVAILVLRKLPPTVTNEDIFKSWVKTTLRHRIIDWFRKNRKSSIYLERIIEPSVNSNQEGVLLYKEILETIDRLPPVQKAVLQMVATGKSFKKIAEELQMSVTTVRSNLRYARANLNKLLELQERG